MELHCHCHCQWQQYYGYIWGENSTAMYTGMLRFSVFTCKHCNRFAPSLPVRYWILSSIDSITTSCKWFFTQEYDHLSKKNWSLYLDISILYFSNGNCEGIFGCFRSSHIGYTVTEERTWIDLYFIGIGSDSENHLFDLEKRRLQIVWDRIPRLNLAVHMTRARFRGCAPARKKITSQEGSHKYFYICIEIFASSSTLVVVVVLLVYACTHECNIFFNFKLLESTCGNRGDLKPEGRILLYYNINSTTLTTNHSYPRRRGGGGGSYFKICLTM